MQQLVSATAGSGHLLGHDDGARRAANRVRGLHDAVDWPGNAAEAIMEPAAHHTLSRRR